MAALREEAVRENTAFSFGDAKMITSKSVYDKIHFQKKMTI